jgi:hypothetical protein
MKKLNLLILGAFLMAASPHAWGAMPTTLNYQGRMTTAAGTGPVPDSTGNTVIFRIFNALSGGTEMWAEEYSSVTTTARFVGTKSGLFNVQLGQFNSINLPFDVPYFLQVEWYNPITPGYETMTPRQPLAMAPYAYRAKYLDAPTSMTSTSIATALFANNTAGGIGLLGSGQVGVLGSGQTGTAGTASTGGGIGVLASDGGQLGALALRAQGKSVFEQNVTFTPGTNVYFNGVNVLGLSVNPVVPMSLVGPVALGGGALSVTNTGTGYGVIAAATAPGYAVGPIDNTQTLTAGIYGYSAVSYSAGVMGINSNSVVNSEAGIIGLAYYQGIIGNAYGVSNTAVGGSFNGGALGTGVSAKGVTGIAASGSTNGTGVFASQNAGYAALVTQGNSIFGGGGGFKSVFAQDVTFSPGTFVYFNGANVSGLPGVTAPLNLSGSFGSPIIQGTNTGGGEGVRGNSTGGNGIYGTGNNGVYGIGSTNDGVYGTGQNAGVHGYSTGGYGVVAQSNNNAGLYAQSDNASAVFAQSGAVSNPGIYAENYNGYDTIHAYSSGGTSADAIYAEDGNAGGGGSGVHGYSTNGTGVYGEGSSEGVFGTSFYGQGVYGQSTYATGVHGVTWGSGAYGVYGANYDGTGASNQYGVYGMAASGSGGIGVYGTGTLYGVQGVANWPSSNAIFGVNWNSFNNVGTIYGYNPGFNNSGSAVFGYNTSAGGQGVLAYNGGGGDAIQAFSWGGPGGGVDAIYGEDDSFSAGGNGVRGYSSNGTGVHGEGAAEGVSGYSYSGDAIYGESDIGNGGSFYGNSGSAVGVYAHNYWGGYALRVAGNTRFESGYNVDFSGASVTGLPGVPNPFYLTGDYGTTIIWGNDTGSASGVRGDSANGVGVYGIGGGTGVYASSTNGNGVVSYSSTNIAVYAQSGGGSDTIQGFSYGTGSPDAIYGEDDSTGGGNGVSGYSSNGTGVYGNGATEGIFGNTSSGDGVYGQSNSSNGVRGFSSTSFGVKGTGAVGIVGITTASVTDEPAGVSATTQNVSYGTGLYAKGYIGAVMTGSIVGLYVGGGTALTTFDPGYYFSSVPSPAVGIVSHGTQAGVSATTSAASGGYALYASSPSNGSTSVAAYNDNSMANNGTGAALDIRGKIKTSSGTITENAGGGTIWNVNGGIALTFGPSGLIRNNGGAVSVTQIHVVHNLVTTSSTVIVNWFGVTTNKNFNVTVNNGSFDIYFAGGLVSTQGFNFTILTN